MIWLANCISLAGLEFILSTGTFSNQVYLPSTEKTSKCTKTVRNTLNQLHFAPQSQNNQFQSLTKQKLAHLTNYPEQLPLDKHPNITYP